MKHNETVSKIMSTQLITVHQGEQVSKVRRSTVYVDSTKGAVTAASERAEE